MVIPQVWKVNSNYLLYAFTKMYYILLMVTLYILRPCRLAVSPSGSLFWDQEYASGSQQSLSTESPRPSYPKGINYSAFSACPAVLVKRLYRAAEPYPSPILELEYLNYLMSSKLIISCPLKSFIFKKNSVGAHFYEK